jgi:hypothetical protein
VLTNVVRGIEGPAKRFLINPKFRDPWLAFLGFCANIHSNLSFRLAYPSLSISVALGTKQLFDVLSKAASDLRLGIRRWLILITVQGKPLSVTRMRIRSYRHNGRGV